MIGQRVPSRLALLALLCCAVLCTRAAAQHSGLAELIATFEAAHEVPEHLAAARESLDLRQRQHENTLLPALGLRQRAAFPDYQHFTFDLDVDLAIPLFRATSSLEAEILRSQVAWHDGEERWSIMEARMNFLRDLLSAALLSELTHDAATALGDFHAAGLLPNLDGTALLRLTPAQRELLALERGVSELQGFADHHLAELQDRLQDTLGVQGPVRLPSFGSLLDELGSAVPLEATCLAAAPASHQAEERFEEQVLSGRLARVPPIQIDLHAAASRGFGSGYGDGYRNARASISLQARLPLPDGWPVVGGINFSAGSEGASQELRLDWPPPVDFSVRDATGSAQAAQRLAAEIELLSAKLNSQRTGLAQARRGVEDSELQLLWLVYDVYGARADDLATARGLADAPFPDVVSELQATQLRSQLALARLSEAEQVLELRLACGDL